MKIIGIIVAAGKGVRMGGTLGKQFLPLGGRSILEHTISGFNESELIDQMVIVLSANDIDYFKSKILSKLTLLKKIQAVIGGEHRQDSVYNGLRQIRAKDGIVLIHDGVRPFARSEQIAATVEKARQTGASILSIPVADTLKRVAENGRIQSTLERESVWMAQTPQVFRFPVIWQAHQAARKAGYIGTDDAELVERLGLPVAVVPGSPYNIKITTPEDLALAKAILASGLFKRPSTSKSGK